MAKVSPEGAALLRVCIETHMGVVRRRIRAESNPAIQAILQETLVKLDSAMDMISLSGFEIVPPKS